jgi:hypothetical protein
MNNIEHTHVTIDGEPATLMALQFHHQVEPWPGGHRFEVRVSVPWFVGELKSRHGLGTKLNLTEGEVGIVFSGLRGIASGQARESAEARGMKPSFWLNSVEEMLVAEDEVLIRGVCSPAL